MKNIIYLLSLIILLSCSNKENKIPENFDFGKAENGLYTNKYFGLKIHFDPSWSIQNKEQMNQLVDRGSQVIAGENESIKRQMKASLVNTAYLLTIFKHEVGSPVEHNPSFLSIAENVKNFPGIKTGEDYLTNVKNTMNRTELDYDFNNIEQAQIGNSKFYVLKSSLNHLRRTINQEFFARIEKGFSLSFIITYANDEEKEELYKIIDSIEI